MTFIELFKKLDVDLNALGKGLPSEFNLAGDVSEDMLVKFIRFLLDTVMVLKTERKWNTGTPTEEGWYLIEVKDWEKQRVYYVPDYISVHDLVLPTVQSFYESHLWQKIELSDEAKDLKQKIEPYKDKN